MTEYTEEDMIAMFKSGFAAARKRGNPMAELNEVQDQTAQRIGEDYLNANYDE